MTARGTHMSEGLKNWLNRLSVIISFRALFVVLVWLEGPGLLERRGLILSVEQLLRKPLRTIIGMRVKGKGLTEAFR